MCAGTPRHLGKGALKPPPVASPRPSPEHGHRIRFRRVQRAASNHDDQIMTLAPAALRTTFFPRVNLERSPKSLRALWKPDEGRSVPLRTHGQENSLS